MSYRVWITRTAEEELEREYQWLLERSRSVERAAAWCDGVLDALESLEALPNRCGLAPESKEFGEPIRQLLYGKRGGIYRILYVVRGPNVRILHVRHGARRLLRPDEIEGEAD